jgi:hypothetical protein
MQLVNESIQLPYLQKTKLKKKKNIKEFNYNKNYEKAINYLNAQEIKINKNYLNYLLNMEIKELYNLTDKKINLSNLSK